MHNIYTESPYIATYFAAAAHGHIIDSHAFSAFHAAKMAFYLRYIRQNRRELVDYFLGMVKKLDITPAFSISSLRTLP